jgi:hypothetical protein
MVLCVILSFHSRVVPWNGYSRRWSKWTERPRHKRITGTENYRARYTVRITSFFRTTRVEQYLSQMVVMTWNKSSLLHFSAIVSPIHCIRMSSPQSGRWKQKSWPCACECTTTPQGQVRRRPEAPSPFSCQLRRTVTGRAQSREFRSRKCMFQSALCLYLYVLIRFCSGSSRRRFMLRLTKRRHISMSNSIRFPCTLRHGR